MKLERPTTDALWQYVEAELEQVPEGLSSEERDKRIREIADRYIASWQSRYQAQINAIKADIKQQKKANSLSRQLIETGNSGKVASHDN